MTLWKEHLNKIQSNHIVAIIAFTIPFGILLSNLSIIIYCLYTFSSKHYWSDLRESFSQRKFILLSFVIFYLLHVVGLLNTDNYKVAFFDLEKKLAIILFPLVIILNRKIDTKGVRYSLMAFVFGCFILTTICLVHSLYFSFFFDSLRIENFTREFLIKPVENYIHPTDLATYCVFCFSCLVIYCYLNRKDLSLINFSILSVLTFIFVFFIFMLASRTPMLAFICIVVLFTGIIALKRLSRIGSFLVLIVTIAFICSVVYMIKPIRKRFSEVVFDSYELPYGVHHNSTNIRMANFVCSMELISQRPIAGYGSGDVQDNLNSCYKQRGFSNILYRDQYNCHNQYFQTWLGQGLAGIISFLICLGALGYYSLKSNHVICTLFLLIVIFSCLTESFLCYQKGIVFYAFFNSLFCSLFFDGRKHDSIFH